MMRYFISNYADIQLKADLQQRIQSGQVDHESFVREALEAGYLLAYDQEREKMHQNRKKIMVVEPHADDGILSVGGTVGNHYTAGDDLISVTIFSKSNQEVMRKQENRFVWETILEGEVVFLDLPDEHKKAKILLFQSYELLKSLIQQKKPDIIYFPAGIGEHIHHTITNLCFRMIYQEFPLRMEYYLYEDYPYADYSRVTYIRPLYQLLSVFSLESVYHLIDKNLMNKATLLMAYKSQYDKKLSEAQEALASYAKAIGYEGFVQGKDILVDQPYERVWKVIDYNKVGR